MICTLFTGQTSKEGICHFLYAFFNVELCSIKMLIVPFCM